MSLCRCGHAQADHLYDRPCDYCRCPEFRHLETPDTLTLRGIEDE